MRMDLTQNFDAVCQQAIAHHRRGDLADAERLYGELLARNPDSFTPRHLLGVLRAQQGRNTEALALIDAALALRPGDAEAWLNHGNVLKAMGRREEALASLGRALAAQPRFPQALNNRALVLQALGRHAEALADADAALAIHPDYAEALNTRGSILQDGHDLDGALAAYDGALARQPALAPAWNNRGSALLALRRPGEALASFARALALRPGDAEAMSNRGNALQALQRFEEAVAAYDQALARNPAYAEAWSNRGGALQELKRFGAALESYDRALAIDPAQRHAFGGAALCALNLCDWARAAAIAADMPSRIAMGADIPPWTLLGYSDDEALQLTCARNAARSLPPQPPLWRGARYRHARIRIAYLSSDFRRHPVAQQIVELIERHDRGRFEVHGVSTGAADDSEIRRRLVGAFDYFHDVRLETPQAIAALLHREEIDIVVDLNGHTKGDNLAILGHRPCPVQATWLGYPGTTGADCIDVVIADAVVAPDARAFSESIVALPDSFFVADTSRTIGTPPTRAEAGLPETGFVFCCFNNNWKIAAPLFDAWMRLLAAVPGSVLWLKPSTDEAAANLRRGAAARGVDPVRLVFAGHAAEDVHLARHGLADLFLDTLPYNAHATACDALWAGLPVLTCRGKAFAGRVAASLLTAIGLPKLIAEDLPAYEALALALARDPARLAALTEKLRQNRTTTALFDTPRFTRNLEDALIALLD